MPTTTKQTIHCRLCNAEIIFDGIQRSQRTGKQIPLDPTTKQPHNCPNYQKQTTLADTNTTTAAATTITATTSSNKPRYVKCKMCNNDIYFEEGRKSDSGKLIPIARLTNKRHQCKYNPTSKKYHPAEWNSEREAEAAMIEVVNKSKEGSKL